MDEKEARKLKEILFCMVYARFFCHGADGHNRILLLAEQARLGGYGFSVVSSGFLLYYKDQGTILEVKQLESWAPE